ncbi:MAG: dienelactone hydrolase family protein [Spirochaetia bacterium]|nr:dienelactone hydrolase family protein [Spirochaetia bacterium]
MKKSNLKFKRSFSLILIPAFFVFSGFLILPSSLSAKIQKKEITYKYKNTSLKGYISYDDKFDGKRPGILVVHEWWGHNDYARKRADMLASLGYTAFALDMYGDGKQAEHPAKAGEFSSAVKKNIPEAKGRFLAAREILSKEPTVDPEKIAAIGYCFGGGIVIEMVRSGVPLKGAVSFHGSLTTDHPAKKKLETSLLVLNGEADPLVTKEHVAAFKKEMENAGIDYRFISYPGAVHSFTVKEATAIGKKYNIPLKYNRSADKKSWKEMKEFLKRIF